MRSIAEMLKQPSVQFFDYLLHPVVWEMTYLWMRDL